MEEKASSDRRKFSRSLSCPWDRWIEATAAEGLGDYASRPIRDRWVEVSDTLTKTAKAFSGPCSTLRYADRGGERKTL